MKVLQINASYKPAYIYGGPTMSVSKLSEELIRFGCGVEVFSTTANGPNELPVMVNKTVMVDGLPVTYFNRITKDHSHFSPALLKTLWNRVKEFDVVHIHAWWNLVSVLSCAIALAKKVPVVLSPRGTLSNYSFANNHMGLKKAFHNFWGKRLLAKCHIHTTSTTEGLSVSELISPLSLTVIPNFVRLPINTLNTGKKPGPKLNLLFFSRIEKKKGLDVLLNALKTVTVPFHLTIAGDGNKDYIDTLKQLAINNGIDEDITWAGFYNDDKFDLLKQHDLMVLPSYNENFGNVVIESLSVGTAVLISQDVGLADYVTQNNLGWICNTDPAVISKTILNIVNNHYNDLVRIRETAPAIISNDFKDDKLVKRYITLYQNIVGHG